MIYLQLQSDLFECCACSLQILRLRLKKCVETTCTRVFPENFDTLLPCEKLFWSDIITVSENIHTQYSHESFFCLNPHWNHKTGLCSSRKYLEILLSLIKTWEFSGTTQWVFECVKVKTYSGMSTMVVIPPDAAACVAVTNPSQSVLPGSLTWTWLSTTPGITARSPASNTCEEMLFWYKICKERNSKSQKMTRCQIVT